jgi:hypothetical protein
VPSKYFEGKYLPVKPEGLKEVECLMLGPALSYRGVYVRADILQLAHCAILPNPPTTELHKPGNPSHSENYSFI